jgi:hypothetical protein
MLFWEGSGASCGQLWADWVGGVGVVPVGSAGLVRMKVISSSSPGMIEGLETSGAL